MNEEKQNANLENEDLNNHPKEEAQAKSASEIVSDSNPETTQPEAQESPQESDNASDTVTSAQDNTEATSENSENKMSSPVVAFKIPLARASGVTSID